MILPVNDTTRLIDYNIRFMITDNPIHPKTYGISKVVDTFPMGVLKLTLVQDHYNQAVDNATLKICNYYRSSNLSNADEEQELVNVCTANGTSSIHYKGSAVVISTDAEVKPSTYLWKYYIDGTEYSIEDLSPYITISEEGSIITTQVLDRIMINKQFTVSLYSKKMKKEVGNVKLEVKA